MNGTTSLAHPPIPGWAAVARRAVAGLLNRPLPGILLNRATLLVVNAATGIITARLLSPAGRGELAALIVAPLFLSGVTTIGLPTALIFQLRRDPDSARRLVAAALSLSAVTGALAAIAGWRVMPFWLSHHPPAIQAGARLFALATPTCSLVITGRAAWEAEGRFWASSSSLLLSSALTLATLIGLGVSHRLTPMTAACAYILTGFAPLAWLLVSLWRSYRPQWRGLVDVSQQLLTYGGRAYGADLCGTLAQYTDQALVLSFLKPEAMGIYVVALSLSRVLMQLQGAVVMMLFPRLVALAPGETTAITARVARLSTVVTFAAAGCMAVGGPIVLRIAYGPAYVEGSFLLAVLLCEAVLAGLTQVLLQPLMACNRPGIATVIQVIGLAAGIPILMVLVPAFGLEGAGVGLLLSTLGRLILSVLAYPYVLDAAIPRLWPSRVDLTDLAQEAGGYWNALRGASVA
jgi:O-antigen/teichoic acid export membrane protein